MAQVTLKNLKKDYGPLTVVHGINLDIKEHEFVVLVGPSGCGKSTTLRMIAGLEDITDGEILIANEKMNNVSPSNRRVAMVFQDYALYPHMTVYENLAFSLRLKKVDKIEIDKRVLDAANMLDLTPFLKRKPSALSGGQRQRVAMGRAIVKRSDVFLFDEPLSNLDAKLRSKMRGEIKKFHKKTKITSVYVTHDQLEAMTLGDRLVVLNNGRIEQVGSPIHVYETPKTVFVATFIGSPGMNMFNATIEEKYDCFYITEEHGIFSFRLPEEKAKYLHDGMKVVMGIRPSDIFITFEGDKTPFDWRAKGTVQMAELLGKNAFITFEVGGKEFLGEVTGKEVPSLDDEVDLSFNLSYIHLFNAETKVNLLHEHDPDLA